MRPDCHHAPEPAVKIVAAPAALMGVQTLAAVALAAAALAAAGPPAPPEAGAEAPRCPGGQALVRGRPAPELFDAIGPGAGRGTWCERYDDGGHPVRTGLYTDTYPSGAPRTRAWFRDDRLDGDVVVLHENGARWLVTHYAAGVIDGPYTLLRPDGRVWIRAFFRAGIPQGTHTLHHPDGTVAAESTWVDGVEQGTSRAWWPNGQLRRERTVVDGVWSGPERSWFPDGRLESRGQWAPCPPEATAPSCRTVGAARHGRWETWHPNGERASRGGWRYGERVGTWVYWDEHGEPEIVSVHRGDHVVHSIQPSPPAALPAVSSSAPAL